MLPLHIALRYLRSKKSSAAVNIISYVTVAGVALAVAAMVVVMSVFNGFSRFTLENLSSIESPLTLYPSSGKVIQKADSLAARLAAVEGVVAACPMISERAFAMAGEQQGPVVMIGVDPRSPLVESLSQNVIDGDADMSPESAAPFAPAIATIGTANMLLTAAYTNQVRVYEPRRVGRINPANPATAFRVDSVLFTGVVSTGVDDFDSDRLIVPLATARRLLNYSDQASSIALYTRPGVNINSLRPKIEQSVAGHDLKILTPEEQQESAMKMINIEKWVTFMMLTFILVIAAFNIVTTMAMMIADKRSNIEIMGSLGATPSQIGMTFATLSMLITAIGVVAGIILGSALALSQQLFGWIKMSADPSTLAITTYPVELHAGDVAVVAVVAIAVGAVAALIASRAATTVARKAFLK